MKKAILSVFVCLLVLQEPAAQKAVVREQKMTFKTYMYSDPNPVPDMEKNYPYFKYDGFTNTAVEREWNMVILENDFIKVYINTDIGGKIWGAIEKSTGKEFLYYNDVVKFRDVAHRGAWTSGGIEFNFGIMSHASTTATPQDYVIRENEDGSVSCIIGAIDLHTGTKWNVDIRLRPDRAYVETRAFWMNTNNVPVSSYHFSNAAAKASGNLQFFYPGNRYIGHLGEVGDWPVENGREISYYEKNNFGSYKSYHVINGYAGYMGGYWHDDDFGFGNLRDYDDMPGKKIWIWGLSDEGMIWVDLLTDTKGQYIEFQTGNLFNQAMPASSLTPFKHREFIPYDTEVANEFWYPVKQTGGMVAASEFGVLNTVRHKDELVIKLCALAPVDAPLSVYSQGSLLEQKRVTLQPMQVFSATVALDSTAEYTVVLGDDMLRYSSNPAEIIVNRPVYANPAYNWESAAGLFTKGWELEKLQSYIEGGYANRKAHELYLKSLALDPAFAPALNRLAFSYYRRMQYDSALDYARQALAIDTYDPEANYVYGLICARLGKRADAKSGFAIAAKSVSYRVAGYTELARMYLQEKRYRKALHYAGKALAFNRYNLVALEIQALAYRLTGNREAAREILGIIEELDPTSAFAANEKALLNGANRQAILSRLITNELAAESYLQLAMQYKNYGCIQQSIGVLKAAPTHAIVHVWLAWLDTAAAATHLSRAEAASPYLVFPFRSDTYDALKSLLSVTDSWKIKYYTALILWKKDRYEEAISLLNTCGTQPDYAPFYLAKAKLLAPDKAKVWQALERARQLAPDDWRVNLALADYYLAGEQYNEAAQAAWRAYRKYPEQSVLGLRYALALLRNGEYDKVMDFLDNLVVIPFEGAVEGRQLYHEAHIRAALQALEKKKYRKALALADKARAWPVNLGTGKPYNADERLEDALMAYCYRQIGNSQLADYYTRKLTEYQVKDGQKENPFILLQLKALQNTGRKKEALNRLVNAMKTDPHNHYLAWVQEVFENKGLQNPKIEKLLQEAARKPLDNSLLLLLDYLKITENN